MDIKGLLYFIVAAERLNFTSAAKECYITQTAMSLHIKKMEDELGFKLFNRNKHATELTRAGRDFYSRAKELVAEYDAAVRHAASVGSGNTGVVGVLVPGCIEGFVIMDRLLAFRKLYPNVEVSLYVESPNRLISRLKMGDADICVGTPDDMELDQDIVVEKLREDPIVVVCSIHHPLARQKKITPEMFRGEPIIVCGSQYSPNAFRVLNINNVQSGFESKSMIIASNMDEMLFLIELERGIGFMPAFASLRISPESAGVAFVPCDFGDRPPVITTSLGYLKNNTNPAIRECIEVLLRK
jgi:DNA-binding transcriptional LysR family regulator